VTGVAPGPSFRVALTFDAELPDRPYEAGVTGRILDALAEASVPATFFVQGRWAEAEPTVAARITADGHLLGNHSHHHARMTMLTGPGFASDVRAAEAAITAATGVNPSPWFRCPFGAGANSARVIGRLAALGYVDVSWHVDGLDWASPTPERLQGRVVRGAVAHGDGAVVLLHGWPTATAEALPQILGRLREAGAAFVRVDALDVVPGRRSAGNA
jgi:peptidoglycan-N-acetylglucosamine deacetylase